ncbi:PAS domain-containing sensor histidine kinase [Rufibacter ruber]|uniref:PAS domain-containing sensor histidine kinase n=1 Tax=Rufibacter ruber TaxID=1783499 RepID=UPI00082D1930|nr:PAS domain-containing protein [Rufibacter ruber]
MNETSQLLSFSPATTALQPEDLYGIFMQAPAMMCVFKGPDHVFAFVNPPYQALVGDRPLLGKPIAEAMPELEGQPIFGLLDRVYQTGEPFHAHEMQVRLYHDNSNQNLGENYYNFVYQATHDLSGQIDGVLVFAYEVTAQVQARQETEKLNLELQTLNQQLETRVQERTQEVLEARADALREWERLQDLFMQALSPICILDGPQLVYQLVNPAYQQAFPGRELLGKPLLEAMPELKTTELPAILENVYQTGQTFVAQEFPVQIARFAEGPLEEMYWNITYQARYNRQGQIDGIMVFASEVADQVHARLAAEGSAQQLRLVTDALPVLISYIDQEEKYQFTNKSYETWFPLKAEDLLGRKVQDVVGKHSYQNVKQYIDRALAGERLDFEATMPYREGFTRHISTSYVPDIQEGEVKGFFALVTDITHQKEARLAVEESEKQAKALAQELEQTNEDLRHTNQQLTHINVDLDNFIYTASHDLKGPILNIDGLLTALLEDLPPDSLAPVQVQQTVELMQKSVQRFKRTIEHLTEITKLQKENRPSTTSVQLQEVFNDALLDLDQAVKEAQAQVIAEGIAGVTFQFSEKSLRSIVYNLLSNAIKYASPERPPVVRLRYRQTSEHHLLSVQDNGLGMNLQRNHQLFGMFQRLHDHVEGSGIGLYMVKRMIDNAGGRIEVESEPGKGSTFTVFLPR